MIARARHGLTLLEILVALVILGLVSVGYLTVFSGSLRLARDARTWSQAVSYAAEGMEEVKLEGNPARDGGDVQLAGGFERRVEVSPWGDGVALVTVVVKLPDGGEFALNRLVRQ